MTKMFSLSKNVLIHSLQWVLTTLEVPERAHTHTHIHTLIFIHALGLICIECNIHSIDLLTQMHSHSQTHTHKYNFPLHSYTDSHTHTHAHTIALLFSHAFSLRAHLVMLMLADMYSVL